ncbi:MAG: 3-oxoacyl-ACP reductase FabG [Gammaproteobacteria bacterium]|nr:MAG: 3-oxoacyl-ACP reductase FabG [Gammaproteobacteria bacterium]
MNETSSRRVALITGATRGIGRAIMLRLADDGFLVAGTATTEAGAQAISDALKDAGFDGSGYALRVDDAKSVEALIEALGNGPGLPLVLINNAGVTRDNLLLRMKEEEWQTVFDTNVGGLYRLCKPLLRPMTKARWGRIINLSSVVGRMGNPGQSNYVASKAAIEGFTRALAQEIGSRSITVNAVAPGFIETDMTDGLTDDQRTAMLARIPLGRMGRVEDVAAVVSFLASDGAAYITGETLQVNGGLYMG